MTEQNKIEVGKLFFEEGLLGFQHLQFFQLLQEEEPDSPFFSLQSMEDKDVGFLVVDPFVFFKDYEFRLHDQAKETLHIKEETPVYILNIVTARSEGQVTVNLKAPIVINKENRMAKQIILNDENYAIRQPLFQLKTTASE